MKNLILIFGLLAACGRGSKPTTNFPAVIDAGISEKIKVTEIHENSMSHFQPYYLGRLIDTVFIDYSIFNYMQPLPVEVPIVSEEEFERELKDSLLEQIDLSINLDTLYFDNYWKGPFKNFRATEDYIFNGESFEKSRRYRSVDSSKFFVHVDTSQAIRDFWYTRDSLGTKSFPVIIRNLLEDTTIVGYGDFAHLEVQAINSKGKWQEIMSRHVYFCGTGVYDLVLPPGYILITSLPCFKGKFKTKIRLKIGPNYSNVIEGEINLSQFE